MNPSAIIFDLDDTLYLERDYAISGFQAVAMAFANRLGPPDNIAATMLSLFDTEHRSRVFDQLLREIGMADDPSLVREMIETYRNHQPAISLLADAERALMRQAERFRLGLITDGHSHSQWNKIDALKLRDRLEAIIVTSDLCDSDCAGRTYAGQFTNYGKPFPLAFELMSERIGVEPRHCVYVADNAAKDFIAPRKLGWRTVQIQRVGGVHTSPPINDAAAPHHVIQTFDLLDELIM
ncbi:MAG: HAD family hydrolase [Planctomycetes bacterium]|nr:HAD family hydrolase [Planctomycetota bacterium]MBI3834886.1 HAD family hydrolase [Planctomycetota bacterium]